MLTELIMEIERTYRVLDADHADMQNMRDIVSWRNNNMISKADTIVLMKHNRRLYQKRIAEEA